MSNQEEDPFNPAKPGPGFVMVSIVGLTNLANYWSIPIIESTLHLRPAKRGLGWRMLSIIGIDQEFFKLVNSTVESTSPGPSFAELHRASSWFDISGSSRRASETFCAGSYRHTENTNCFILELRDIITGVAREVKEEIHKKHISCLNEQEIHKDKHRDKKEICKDKKKDKDKEKSDISEEAKVAVLLGASSGQKLPLGVSQLAERFLRKVNLAKEKDSNKMDGQQVRPEPRIGANAILPSFSEQISWITATS
ncbi:hypothetical protein CQW23_29110 [Capsicum baccatum]|uniref:Uncharacterized protein n=1 Tax=Capsicum baccatum TaxID=33114 RepID=A0A2G2VIH6_CAPBA|nr:hypothetical protein CQW23_29110 [Capsicum baccatum]